MLAIAGQPIPLEVTLESGLAFVAMKVFDVTAGFPGTLFGAAIAMVEYDEAAYGASFVGVAGKSYVVTKAVYTDGTFATRDENFASGSDSVQVMSSGASAPTVQEIVDGVLDELLGGHLDAGSVGEAIAKAAGPIIVPATVQANLQEAVVVDAVVTLAGEIEAVVTSVVELKPC